MPTDKWQLAWNALEITYSDIFQKVTHVGLLSKENVDKKGENVMDREVIQLSKLEGKDN